MAEVPPGGGVRYGHAAATREAEEEVRALQQRVDEREEEQKALHVKIATLAGMCRNPDVWDAQGGPVTFKGVLSDDLKKSFVHLPPTKAAVRDAVLELKEEVGFVFSLWTWDIKCLRLAKKCAAIAASLQVETLTVDMLVTHIKQIFKEDTLGTARQYDPKHEVLVPVTSRRRSDAGVDVFVGRDHAVQVVSAQIKSKMVNGRGRICGQDGNPLISVQQGPGFGNSLFLTRLPVEMKDSGLPETTIYCPLSFRNGMAFECTARPDEDWSLGWRMVFGAFKSMASCRLKWSDLLDQIRQLHCTHTCVLLTFVKALQRLFGEAYTKRSTPSICVGDEEETPLTPEQCEEIPVVIMLDDFDKQMPTEGIPAASVIRLGVVMDALPAVFAIVSHRPTNSMFGTGSHRPVVPVILGVLTTEEKYKITEDIFLPQDGKSKSRRVRDWLAHLGFGHPRAIHYTACFVRRVLEGMRAKGGPLTEEEWQHYFRVVTFTVARVAHPQPMIDREAVLRLSDHEMRQISKASLLGLYNSPGVSPDVPLWIIECVLLNSSEPSIACLERRYGELSWAFKMGFVHVIPPGGRNDSNYHLDVLPLGILSYLRDEPLVSAETHPSTRLMQEVLGAYRQSDELLGSNLPERVSALFSLLAIRDSRSRFRADLLPSCNVKWQELPFGDEAPSLPRKKKRAKQTKNLKPGRVKKLVSTLYQKPPVLGEEVPPGVYLCPPAYPCVDYIIKPREGSPIGVSVKALVTTEVEALLVDLEASREAFQMVYPEATFVAHVLFEIPPELKAKRPWVIDASVLRSVIPASFLELASWNASNRFEDESTPTGKCLRSRPVWLGVSSGEPSRELGMRPPPPVFLPSVLESRNPCAHTPTLNPLGGASRRVLSGQRRSLWSSAFPQRGWAPWGAKVLRHVGRLV